MNGSVSGERQATVASDRGGSTMNHRLGFTGRIARAAARHPWRVLGLWVALLAVAYFAAGAMNLSASPSTAGTEATRAKDLIDQRLRQQTPPQEFVVVESQATIADEKAYSTFVDSLVSNLRALKEVDSVASYRDGAQGLVSRDGHTVLIPVTLTGNEEDAANAAAPVVDVVKEASGTGGFRVTTVGFGSVGRRDVHAAGRDAAAGRDDRHRRGARNPARRVRRRGGGRAADRARVALDLRGRGRHRAGQ